MINFVIGLVTDLGKIIIFLMFIIAAFLVGMLILLTIWGLFL